MDYGSLVDHLVRSSMTLHSLGCTERQVVEGLLSEIALCGGPTPDHIEQMIRHARHPILDAPVDLGTSIPIKRVSGGVVQFPVRYRKENCQGE